LASTVLFAVLYEYGLVVLIRSYRYLRDKVAYESQTNPNNNIFVLPTRINGQIILPTSNEAMIESRMYTDLPPEYAAAVTMMTIEDSTINKNTNENRIVEQQQQQQQIKTESVAPVLRHDDETRRQQSTAAAAVEQEPSNLEITVDNHHTTDEHTPPPTYEEARQLQNSSRSSIISKNEF